MKGGFWIILCFPLLVSAQDSLYSRRLVDTLASPYFQGRGYINNGVNKAGNFLIEEFKKIGVKPVTNSYKQEYSFPVNTFPETPQLTVGNKSLEPGVDFIVGPSSGSCKGRFKVLKLTKTDCETEEKLVRLISTCVSSALLIDKQAFTKEEQHLIEKRSSTVPLVIYLEKKLTWSVSGTVSKQGVLHVKKESFPDAASDVEVDITSRLIKDFTSFNVIGCTDKDSEKDSCIVLTAHYDHLGAMGDVFFPGANDNASGVAMLLSLAKFYAEHPARYPVVFIAFSGEEAGLLGSEYYVNHPLLPLRKIKFLINMDLLGTGDEGLMVVNGSVYEKEFNTLDSLNKVNHYLKEIRKRGKAANSDHYHFSEKGVKAFFIYTLGGISAYHDIYDRPGTLPLTRFKEVFHLITSFVSTL